MDLIIPRVLYWQFFERLEGVLDKADFTGQTIIVTGANVGLGFEAVRHFLKLNAQRVILACRTVTKGEDAKALLEESTGRKGAVDVWKLDLNSYDSVKAFAEKVHTLDRVDAIIENAGVSTADFQITEQDESTITTNVTSTFLLALLVLPKLRESASKFNIVPRLTIVASEVHYMATLTKEAKSPSIFDYLKDESKARMGFPRYCTSKLLECLYSRELAAQMSESGKPFVILNYINPGLCHSQLAPPQNFVGKIAMAILARKTDVGARTLVAGVTAGKESHGQFMTNAKIHE